MKTIKIYRFGTDDDFWRLIIDLYDHWLINDDWWHCFWEGDFLELRVKEVGELEAALDERGIQFDVEDYEDASPTVREFIDSFLEIFHIISVFHIQVYKAGGWLNQKQVHLVTDRIVHAFFNMGWGSLADIQKGWREGMLEATTLDDIARGRAFYAGMRHVYKRQLDKDKEV
jgi:hypothetical protein